MSLMDADPVNPKSLFLYLMGMWGKTGINCFVLITGYFMCKSEITLRKFLKLLLEIEFYKIVIHFSFVVTGYIPFSLKEFLWFLLPIDDITDGFVSCYLVFFLFIPFLNALIHNLDKKQHLLLMFLCLSVYSFWNTLPGVEVGVNDSIWFCILYVTTSYLRLYPVEKDNNTCFWIFMLLLTMGLAMASVLSLAWARQYEISFGAYALVGCPWNTIAFLVSISVFMFFKSLNMAYSKWINVVGGGTFGVLLIHANSDTMRLWLWRDVFDNLGHYATNSIYLHAIFVPIIVFVVCSLIEYVRMKTIERPILDFTYNTIRKYFPNAK